MKIKKPSLQDILRGKVQDSVIKRHSNKRFHAEQAIMRQVQQDAQNTQIRNELLAPKQGNLSIPVESDIRDLKKEKRMLDNISKIISQEMVNIHKKAIEDEPIDENPDDREPPSIAETELMEARKNSLMRKPDSILNEIIARDSIELPFLHSKEDKAWLIALSEMFQRRTAKLNYTL